MQKAFYNGLINKALSLCFIVFTLLNTSIQAQCPKLVWSDEFGGTALDQTKWSYQIGDGCDINLCQWGNNELQWYAQENVSVSNGILKIVAKKETIQSRAYTSGRIRTINKGDIKYGRIEARMKMPIGKGVWPAFWMLPTDNIYGVWPQSGEIDIMEYLGHEPANVLGTLHFGNVWPNNQYISKTFTLTEGGFNDDFHTFALEWSSNEIKWFVDGYQYARRTSSDLGGSRWPFDQKFHFLLNMAVGGNLPGNPNSSTVFPQTFEVDYVRVYDLVGAPNLVGSQKVPFMAKNSTYSIENVPTGSTIAWTIPAGATIVNGNGTKDLVINWGSVGGKIAATVTNSCGETKHELIVQVEANFSTAVILENFDTPAKINLTSNAGTYTDNFATPSPNAINKSALCGKYVRNSSQQYDFMSYDIADITNAADFTSSEKKFYIDMYTTAPVGTSILLQLENKSTAQGSNYPVGRHSRYTAVTTKQNEWERLQFVFTDKPDANTSNFAVNQLILLFSPNTFTGATYYYDNLEIYAKGLTSTVDIEKNYTIQLAPNPVTDVLNVAVDKDKTIENIEIVDSAGRSILFLKNINNTSTQVPVQSLLSGMYYLNISFKDALKVTKSFVKK
jgi:beta-glucanase (GH16 family)